MTLIKSSIGVPKFGNLLRDLLPESGTRERATDQNRPINPSSQSASEPREEQVTDSEQTPVAGQSAVARTSTVDPDEAAMIRQAQQDPDMFGLLYERYIDRVYAYIYNRVGNAQDAEDLTARTFYKALSRLDSYEDRGFPFSAWLFRIAHNLVANWHRDHSKWRFLSLDRIWSHSKIDELPEQHIEQEETHEALWDAINRLPEERRDLLIYKFSSRLSNLEIGEIMDKSESAIKSLYFRTLATLRTDLEARDWEK